LSSIMFASYFLVSLIYIANVNFKFKRQLNIYCEKFSKLQNEKKLIKKKYQNLFTTVNKIKEISSTEDRSAKKVCLIISALQNKF
jgi:hypothetical protein